MKCVFEEFIIIGIYIIIFFYLELLNYFFFKEGDFIIKFLESNFIFIKELEMV